MFYLRAVSPERSDCTTAYEIDCVCFVDPLHKFTVKDFIKSRIESGTKEFGSIYFGPKFGPEWRSGKGFRYSNFKDVDIILEIYGDQIIKSPIKCDGGLGRMDYWIELEEEVNE